jgi:hypothetical protein
LLLLNYLGGFGVAHHRVGAHHPMKHTKHITQDNTQWEREWAPISVTQQYNITWHSEKKTEQHPFASCLAMALYAALYSPPDTGHMLLPPSLPLYTHRLILPDEWEFRLDSQCGRDGRLAGGGGALEKHRQDRRTRRHAHLGPIIHMTDQISRQDRRTERHRHLHIKGHHHPLTCRWEPSSFSSCVGIVNAVACAILVSPSWVLIDAFLYNLDCVSQYLYLLSALCVYTCWMNRRSVVVMVSKAGP